MISYSREAMSEMSLMLRLNRYLDNQGASKEPSIANGFDEGPNPIPPLDTVVYGKEQAGFAVTIFL